MNYLLRKTVGPKVREIETDSKKIRDRAIKRGFVLQKPEPTEKKRGH